METVKKCVLCPFTTNSVNKFTRHLNSHANSPFYYCIKKDCKLKFEGKHNIRKHINTHIDKKNFFCDICENKFLNGNQLKRHIATHKEECFNQKKKDKRFFCDLCNFKTHKNDILKYHIMRHSENKEFKCTKCDKEFIRNIDLLNHLENVHKGEKNLQCAICGFKTSINDILLIHYKKHNIIKKFKCEECDKCYNRLSKLNIHLKTHIKKEVLCCYCNTLFLDLDQLSEHTIKEHSLNKDYIFWEKYIDDIIGA
jgi:KRAB domain-containing zinc finger protein